MSVVRCNNFCFSDFCRCDLRLSPPEWKLVSLKLLQRICSTFIYNIIFNTVALCIIPLPCNTAHMIVFWGFISLDFGSEVQTFSPERIKTETRSQKCLLHCIVNMQNSFLLIIKDPTHFQRAFFFFSQKTKQYKQQFIYHLSQINMSLMLNWSVNDCFLISAVCRWWFFFFVGNQVFFFLVSFWEAIWWTHACVSGTFHVRPPTLASGRVARGLTGLETASYTKLCANFWNHHLLKQTDGNICVNMDELLLNVSRLLCNNQTRSY